VAEPDLVKLGIRLAAAVAVVVAIATAAMAQNYPDRPIRMISPHPVGVATDVIGRALALKLQDDLGQAMVMENHPGANGIIAEAWSPRRRRMATRCSSLRAPISPTPSSPTRCRSMSSRTSRRSPSWRRPTGWR
jgi:hypothetical protein